MTKYAPYIVGGLIGIFIASPPEALEDMGSKGTLLVAALGFVAFFIFVAATLLRSLSPTISEGGESVSEEGEKLISEFVELGFERQGSLTVDMTPAATLVPLIHREKRLHANVFTTGNLPPITSFDIISSDGSREAGLTSMTKNAGAAIPASPESFRQVKLNATPRELMELHLEGAEYLESAGLKFDTPDSQNLAQFIRDGIAHQHRNFKKSPIKNTLITIFRAMTGTHPHKGPLSTQAGVKEQLRKLVGARL